MKKLILLVVGGIALVSIIVIVLVSVYSADTKSETVIQQKEESMENQKNVTAASRILFGCMNNVQHVSSIIHIGVFCIG